MLFLFNFVPQQILNFLFMFHLVKLTASKLSQWVSFYIYLFHQRFFVFYFDVVICQRLKKKVKVSLTAIRFIQPPAQHYSASWTFFLPEILRQLFSTGILTNRNKMLRQISIQRMRVARLTQFDGEWVFFQSPFKASLSSEMFCLLNKFVFCITQKLPLKCVRQVI